MSRAFKLSSLVVVTMLTLVGCGEKTSFSILPDGDTFQQSDAPQETKIDVLWLIDNSGSMKPSQDELAANFPQFIQEFTRPDRAYDFKMAVATTDAFLAMPVWSTFYKNNPRVYEYKSQAEKAKFRDGVGSTHSGFFVLDNNTPNLHNNFMINIMQGIDGWGDERSFQSMRAALESPLNSGFLRNDSFLAVIIVTDEDDFSHDGTTHLDGQYNNSALHSINSYVSFLDGFTSSTGATRRYSVNSVQVKDSACANKLKNGTRIAVRVGQLVDATKGMKADICGNFGTELKLLGESIVQLASKFPLSRKPLVDTIKVFVNGVMIPSVATNPGPQTGGWEYDAPSNSIVFYGDYLPPQGSIIDVTFDPDGVSI